MPRGMVTQCEWTPSEEHISYSNKTTFVIWIEPKKDTLRIFPFHTTISGMEFSLVLQIVWPSAIFFCSVVVSVRSCTVFFRYTN